MPVHASGIEPNLARIVNQVAPANMNHHKHSADARAFIPEPADHAPADAIDDLAEALGEDFIASATSAEEAGEDARDEVLPEEWGGPFLEVPASEEFDLSPDESNPPDAEREPFPVAVRGVRR
jgi:hypothetical protein